MATRASYDSAENRYKHDLEQAELMRRGAGRRGDSNNNNNSNAARYNRSNSLGSDPSGSHRGFRRSSRSPSGQRPPQIRQNSAPGRQSGHGDGGGIVDISPSFSTSFSPSASPTSVASSSSSTAAPGGGAASASGGVDPKRLTASDVNLALQGLDQAEGMKLNHRYDEAMRLYELAIEVLIRFLNSTQEERQRIGISKDVIAQRVRVALTDAEHLKTLITANQQKQQQQQQQQQLQGSTQYPGKTDEKHSSPGGKNDAGGGKWTSLSSALSSVLGGKTPTGTGGRRSPHSTSAPTTKTNRKSPTSSSSSSSSTKIHTTRKPTGTSGISTSSSSRTTGMTKSSSFASRSTARGRSPTYTNTPSTTNQHQPQQQRQQRRPQRRTRLDYNNDPLVKVVKSDLYVDPSSLHTKWDDISGLETAKRSLQEAAILPLLRPDLYKGLRKPPKGILLYGPPGTGKTMLVRAVAHESKCLLFACTASALTSKWHGEGEKLVRTLFRVAYDVAPSIIFLDEIDALLSTRKTDEHEASRRFKTEFMIQMDGIISDKGDGSSNNSGSSKKGDGGTDNDEQCMEHHVLIMACTNCPWDIDDAVMRRFQRRIYVPLPDEDARRALLTHMLQKAENDHNLTPREIDQLVQMTAGFSCSDISSIANEAAFGPLRSLGGIDVIRDVRKQDIRPISLVDFKDAIANSKRSVSGSLLARYDEWERAQAAVSS